MTGFSAPFLVSLPLVSLGYKSRSDTLSRDIDLSLPGQLEIDRISWVKANDNFSCTIVLFPAQLWTHLVWHKPTAKQRVTMFGLNAELKNIVHVIFLPEFPWIIFISSQMMSSVVKFASIN